MKSYAKLAACAALAAVSCSANALVVLDGWQMTTSGGTTTDIGHLVVSGGNAIVNQEINGSGNPFVGARFEEFGSVFSVSFTTENTVGLLDNGAPGILAGPVGVEFVFDGLAGVVTGVSGTGGITYAFTPGVGSITLRESVSMANLATFDVVSPSTGSFGNSIFSGGSTGTTSLTAIALTSVAGTFADSLGTPLDALIASGGILAVVATTNVVDAANPFVGPTPCSFDAAATCAVGQVNSQGQFNLAEVPEPAVISMLGLGLLGMVGAKKRLMS